jgi:hypothetical protein
MKPADSREFVSGLQGLAEAEEVLRRLASLPAPEGLEERVKALLAAEPRMGRVLEWPRATDPGVRRADSGWRRGIAAAALVAVVTGGSWSIYLRTQAAHPPAATVRPPWLAGPGNFSSAGAIRTPQTLVAPTVHPKAQQEAAQSPETKPAASASKTHTHKSKGRRTGEAGQAR